MADETNNAILAVETAIAASQDDDTEDVTWLTNRLDENSQKLDALQNQINLMFSDLMAAVNNNQQQSTQLIELQTTLIQTLTTNLQQLASAIPSQLTPTNLTNTLPEIPPPEPEIITLATITPENAVNVPTPDNNEDTQGERKKRRRI